MCCVCFFKGVVWYKVCCCVFVQVTVEYHLEGGACIPLRVHTIVISVQHSDKVGLQEIREALREKIIKVGPKARMLKYHSIPCLACGACKVP